MKNIRMVVFDMAGTTVNENNVVYKTLQKSINEAGYNFTLDQVLEQGAGNEKSEAIRKVLKAYAGIEDTALVNAIYQKFVVQLADAYNQLEILAADNAAPLFKALKEQHILAVLNTGYNRETAQLLVNRLGWEEGREFDLLVTSSEVEKSRPNPDMILFAMAHFGIEDASSVVKIGDSIIDIEEGKNAGCGLNIGITGGAHTAEQLRSGNPDYVLNNLIELLPVLESR